MKNSDALLTKPQLARLISLAKAKDDGSQGLRTNRKICRPMNGLVKKQLARVQWGKHDFWYSITERGERLVDEALELWNRPARIVLSEFNRSK